MWCRASLNTSWAINQDWPRDLSTKVWENPWAGSSSVWATELSTLLFLQPSFQALTALALQSRVYLELSQDIDEDPSVKHWLAVNGGNDVLDLLEGETSELLHDLGGPLHLLALKRQEGLLWVVELLEVGPGGIEVRIIHILLCWVTWLQRCQKYCNIAQWRPCQSARTEGWATWWF